MTDTEIIEVVAAHAAGKKIEYARLDSDEDFWQIKNMLYGWDFQTYRYRVAPEPRKPREWTVVEINGHIYSKFDGVFQSNQYFLVREVIE